MNSKEQNRKLFEVPEDSMVFARSVRKNFGGVEVLKGVDLNVPEGTVTCIIGPSGSGKSTFLRCINHLEEMSSGILLVDKEFVGHDLRGGKLYKVRNDLLCRRRADIGMVFQSFNLFSHFTVLENLIEAPIIVKKVGREEAIERAHALLGQVGLSEKAGFYPNQLSGGQQQRVAIARALAMQPKVILFDEPTSALDPELIGEVLLVMRDLAESGMTMIVVTHEIGFAREVGDQLVFMENGVVEERGHPRDVIANPASARTRDFLSHIL